MKKQISVLFLIFCVSMASCLIVQAAPVTNVQDNKLILSGNSENNKSVTVVITDSKTGEIVFLDEQVAINGKYSFETILPSGEFSARVVAGTSPADSITINTEKNAVVSSTPNVPPAATTPPPVTTSSSSKKINNSKGASKSQSESQDSTPSQVSQSNDDISTSEESVSGEIKTFDTNENDKVKEEFSFLTVFIIVLIIFITAAIIIYIINKKRK